MCPFDPSSLLSVMGSLLDQVEIHEAGKVYIVSGKDETIVNYVMAQLRNDGARNAGVAVRLGNRWIASFEHPLLHECEANKEGFRITVTGPTKEIVLIYGEQFTERGSVIETGPVQVGDRWFLYLVDDAARTRTTFFS